MKAECCCWTIAGRCTRSPFKANFDGRDRWLRRMMIGTTNDAGDD